MIIEEITDTNGDNYFKASENGVEGGRIYYTQKAGTIIIDHTEVNPDFSGKGVGKKLVIYVVQAAREKNIKIRPDCPFARSVFDKTPEIRDVLA